MGSIKSQAEADSSSPKDRPPAIRKRQSDGEQGYLLVYTFLAWEKLVALLQIDICTASD